MPYCGKEQKHMLPLLFCSRGVLTKEHLQHFPQHPFPHEPGREASGTPGRCSEHHDEHQQPDPGGSMGWHGHHTLNSCSYMISGTPVPFTEGSWRPSSLLTKVTRSFYIYIWLPNCISTICFLAMILPTDSTTKEATLACVINPTTLGGSWLEAITKKGLLAKSKAIMPMWVLLEFVLWDG